MGIIGGPLADWKEVGNYPDPAEANYSQWAWEFLRRNDRYQADYRLYESLGFRRGVSSVLTNDSQVPHIVICEPPCLKGETFAQWKKRCWSKRKQYAPKKYFQIAYRVDYVVSPLQAECHPFMFGPLSIRYSPYLEPGEDEPLNSMIIESEEEVAVKLRLDVPIDIQLKAIKRAIERMPSYSPFDTRLHVSKFALYLRAHDGRLAGATAREIADRLSIEDESGSARIDEKAVSNFWASAERLIGSDYWKIAASAAAKR